MKAATINLQPSNGYGVRDGKIKKCRDPAVTEEMQMYFSKLQELVPFMPKNRKLSKLQIIQCVIDYICDLQFALETQHPAMRNTTAAQFVQQLANTSVLVDDVGDDEEVPPMISGLQSPRRPLGVIADNSSLSSSHLVSSQIQHNEISMSSDKSRSDDDATRPVSC